MRSEMKRLISLGKPKKKDSALRAARFAHVIITVVFEAQQLLPTRKLVVRLRLDCCYISLPAGCCALFHFSRAVLFPSSFPIF